MRTLQDDLGRAWSVDVMAGSYGVCYLMFSAEQAGEARKTPMAADSQREAAVRLAAMSEDELRTALRESSDFAEVSELGF